jgi:hypothetical protein
MKTFRDRIVKILTNRNVVGIALIVVGLLVLTFFGLRAVRSFRTLQYIREQGLDRGVASVEAIRPWMTIRYVSVAYGVPQEYIFAELEIPFDRRSSNDTVGHLNQVFQLGRSDRGEYPAIIDNIAAAILAYQADPVATGLDDVRPWMTIRYIANSTGVPETYLLEQLGLSVEDNNVYKPLDELAGSVRYDGGPRALVRDLGQVLRQYEEAP